LQPRPPPPPEASRSHGAHWLAPRLFHDPSPILPEWPETAV
jgi:hypothetical protein